VRYLAVCIADQLIWRGILAGPDVDPHVLPGGAVWHAMNLFSTVQY